METICFFIQGTAIEPYKVTFQKRGSKLSAYCTCPAGVNGQFCKHRFRILTGVDDGIVSNNKHEVEIIKTYWLNATNVESALYEVTEKEKILEKAKKDLVYAKKKLAQTMRD